MIAHKLSGDKGILFTAVYVKQFHEMGQTLLEHQSLQWQTARHESKKTRRLETDAIKAFVQYATDHGSKSASKYYIHFTKLANEVAGVTDRNTSDTSMLLDLRMAEQFINNAISLELAAETEYHKAFSNMRNKVQQVAGFVFAPKMLKVS